MRTDIVELEIAIRGAWEFAIDSDPWMKRAETPKPQSRGDVAKNAMQWAEALKGRKRRRRMTAKRVD